MKKILFTVLTLAATFGVIAFAANREATRPAPLDEEWFIYVSGPVGQPSSYQMVSTPPVCDGTGALCAIYAPKQENANLPTQAGLNYLASISDNFANIVTGLVEHKTP